MKSGDSLSLGPDSMKPNGAERRPDLVFYEVGLLGFQISVHLILTIQRITAKISRLSGQVTSIFRFHDNCSFITVFTKASHAANHELLESSPL